MGAAPQSPAQAAPAVRAVHAALLETQLAPGHGLLACDCTTKSHSLYLDIQECTYTHTQTHFIRPKPTQCLNVALTWLAKQMYVAIAQATHKKKHETFTVMLGPDQIG